jgi:hypothetical protein
MNIGTLYPITFTLEVRSVLRQMCDRPGRDSALWFQCGLTLTRKILKLPKHSTEAHWVSNARKLRIEDCPRRR